MGTLRVGRASLETDRFSGWSESAASGFPAVELAGFFRGSSTAITRALRDELVSLADSGVVVPVTWTGDASLDGYYRVTGADIEVQKVKAPGLVRFGLSLERRSKVGRFASRLTGGLRANEHGFLAADVSPIAAPPPDADNFDAGDTVPSSILRASEDGDIRVYLDVTPSGFEDPEWSVAPSDYYDAAAKIVVDGRERSGLWCPNTPTSWEVSNGLVRVKPGAGSRLTAEFFDGAVWESPKVVQVGWSPVLITSTGITFAAGKYGNGALLQSGDKIVYGVASEFEGTKPVTICGWYKPDAAVDLLAERYLGQLGANNARGLECFIGATGQTFVAGRSGSGSNATLTAPFVVGDLIFWAVRYNGSTRQVSVKAGVGALAHSAPAGTAGSVSGIDRLNIGHDAFQSDQEADGVIDNVMVFDRALTDDEVSAIASGASTTAGLTAATVGNVTFFATLDDRVDYQDSLARTQQTLKWNALAILRNDAEVCAVRLEGQDVAAGRRWTVDLTLRRGSRFVEGRVVSSNPAEDMAVVLIADGAPGTSLTGAVRATSDDTDGNRYVVGSSRTFTAITERGGLSKNAAGKLDFFVGAERAGTGAQSGDKAADLVKQYLGYVDEHVRLVV